MADATIVPNLVEGVSLSALIGQGGFASVYRGTQTSLGREVAVKIDSRIMDDERNRRRFLREARAAARISGHPHVVSLYDVGTTADGRPYLVMELCEGGSVNDLIKRGPMPVADAVQLAIAVTGALAAAHDAGVLHRDVKPGNILIDAWGVPRLGDFGLAAMPQPGEENSVTIEAFTPAYAAPECFSYAQPSTQADVWSMGASIHAMVTGTAPRRASDGSPASLPEIMARLDEPLTRPGVPGADVLMPVLWKATARRLEDRYKDAGELLEALREIAARVGPPHLEDEGLTTVVRVPAANRVAPPAPPVPRLGPAWGLALAGLLVGALVGAGGVLAIRHGDPAPDPSPSTASGPPPSPGAPEDLPPAGECWNNLVVIGGEVMNASKVPCTSAHRGETWASGTFDAATNVYAAGSWGDDPNVRRVCSKGTFDEYTGKATLPKRDGYVFGAKALAKAPDYRGFACVAWFSEDLTASVKK